MNAAETNTVTIKPVEGHAALYCRYDGQLEPQQPVLQLDCDDGELSCTYKADPGSAGNNSMPMTVWHGRTLWWNIVALRADGANQLMQEVKPLADRILTGYTCEWDGSNHVGRLREDAQQAAAEIEDICDEYASDESAALNIWGAGDWLGGIGDNDAQRAELGISGSTTDQEIAAIATRVLDEADCDVIEYLEEHLRTLRDEAEK